MPARRIKPLSALPPMKVRLKFMELLGCTLMHSGWSRYLKTVDVDPASIAQVADILHIEFGYKPPHAGTSWSILDLRGMLVFLSVMDGALHPRSSCAKDGEPNQSLDVDDSVVDALRKVLTICKVGAM